MQLDFSKSPDGLIPAIIQDFKTQKVLMLGYMNSKSLEETRLKKKVTFFSRSKKRLWTKGETSGNFLEVVEISDDCDNDSLLIKVNPAGPVCHTGNYSCFGEKREGDNFLDSLENCIEERKSFSAEKSYTKYLFDQGVNKIAQKVGEEAVELVIEAKDNSKELFLGEAADLIYHFLVLLNYKGFRMGDVINTLKERHK